MLPGGRIVVHRIQNRRPFHRALTPATITLIRVRSKQNKGKISMGSTIRARFSGGTLKPLEALELKEGDEVTITIVSSLAKSKADWLERTAGGWTGLVDAAKLKREISDSRLIATRPEPRL